MAEAVVSIALETFRDLLLEEGRFLFGVGDEVKALQKKLKEMKCLLQDADRRQHESKIVANWIAEIRDLAYKAEDVIETYAARVPSKRGRGLKNLLRRFSSILKECCSLHQIGSEISQIKSELERVRKSMQEYGIRSIIQGQSSSTDDINQQYWKRQTFPDFQIEDCFVGKEDELKQIVSLAVDDNQHRVVSIWGMGGIGKTTVARKVYNHIDTKRHFQCFAWVCITQQCQIRSVLEDVLKQLNPLKRDFISNLSNMELIGELCQIQKAKRCMIVLDDLWETDHWDGLKHAFLVQDLKSEILVTTRKQRVADHIGFAIQLGLLSMDSGCELLKMKAFPCTNIPDFAFEEKWLQKIGKEMVKKCGCLPLAISLLGGVLSKRKSKEEWELVKERINAYLLRGDGIEKENEMHAVLNLSYEDLPYYLKPCFLYMGLFKEDQEFLSRNIYKMWIAQGMVSPENLEEESLTDIAELYLSELASRCIVQVDIYEDAMPGQKYVWCKLHDVVRELCLSIGKREGFGLQNLAYQGGKFSTLMHESLSGIKARHLGFHFEGEIEPELDRGEFAITGDEDTSKRVRSLLLLNHNVNEIEFPHSAIDLQIFKLLRVLHFMRLKLEGKKLPKGIGNLIHLRYLRFEACELDELPSSIGNLSYLQTLYLDDSWDVEVPNVFKKLFRLKHLYLPPYTAEKVRNYLLELDEGLDELETLAGFDSSMHQLKSITRMKNLRYLGARVRDNESLSAVIDAVNTNWKNLQFGNVIIEQGCQFTSTEEGLMVLKKVFTCPNIHQLYVHTEIGKRLRECRNQVSSSRLLHLYLLDCEIEDDPMEILGKLPVLKLLQLSPRSFVGEEMTCRASCFPRLKQLFLDRLPNLREWRVEEGAMPLLSEITIINCPHLMMLPDGLRFISTLQNLTITGMPGLGKRVLASEDDDSEGEDFDKVRRLPSIIIN